MALNASPLTIIEIRVANQNISRFLGSLDLSKGKLLQLPRRSACHRYVEYMAGWASYDQYVLFQDNYQSLIRHNTEVPPAPRKVAWWVRLRNSIRLYGKRSLRWLKRARRMGFQ